MYSEPRELSYSLAINEAIRQAMAADASVMLLGQGVKSPWYVGNTAKGLLDDFGPLRVIDTPVSENAVTGAGVGAALAGMRPVVVHPRMDFMLYAMDPIVNQAANWHYMSGGRLSVPVVFWGIINRGNEQGAQHSQAIFSMFCHVPGLKVVAPSRPVEAKGLMMAAIRDDNPVLFVDERSLYPHQVFFPMAGSKDGWFKLKKKVTVVIVDTDKTYSFRNFHFTPRPKPLRGIHSNGGILAYLAGRIFKLRKRPTPLAAAGQELSAEEALKIANIADKARGPGSGTTVWKMASRFHVTVTGVTWGMLASIKHKPIVIVRKNKPTQKP